MELKNGGLEDHFSSSIGWFCRFHPTNHHGISKKLVQVADPKEPCYACRVIHPSFLGGSKPSGQMKSRPHTSFHPKWWFSKGIPLISGKSRLVKYDFIWPETMILSFHVSFPGVCLKSEGVTDWSFALRLPSLRLQTPPPEKPEKQMSTKILVVCCIFRYYSITLPSLIGILIMPLFLDPGTWGWQDFMANVM